MTPTETQLRVLLWLLTHLHGNILPRDRSTASEEIAGVTYSASMERPSGLWDRMDVKIWSNTGWAVDLTGTSFAGRLDLKFERFLGDPNAFNTSMTYLLMLWS